VPRLTSKKKEEKRKKRRESARRRSNTLAFPDFRTSCRQVPAKKRKGKKREKKGGNLTVFCFYNSQGKKERRRLPPLFFSSLEKMNRKGKGGGRNHGRRYNLFSPSSRHLYLPIVVTSCSIKEGGKGEKERGEGK